MCSLQQGLKGGSLASDNVVSLVSCDTFEQMNSRATNSVTGGGLWPKRKTTKAKSGKKSKAQRGGSDCPPTTTSMLDSYVLGPASVPSGIPMVNDGTLGTSMQASVLMSLSQQPPDVTATYHSIIYPDEFVANNIMVKSMTGGNGGCLCDL